jgi:Cu+-exporting ATPase
MESQVVMGIADELGADAAGPTLRYLQDRDGMGIDVWMVTGDNSRTASAIARKLGLSEDRVISEALPVAKVQQVKKLQREAKWFVWLAMVSMTVLQ